VLVASLSTATAAWVGVRQVDDRYAVSLHRADLIDVVAWFIPEAKWSLFAPTDRVIEGGAKIVASIGRGQSSQSQGVDPLWVSSSIDTTVPDSAQFTQLVVPAGDQPYNVMKAVSNDETVPTHAGWEFTSRRLSPPLIGYRPDRGTIQIRYELNPSA
jgi:hypothetical protein